MVTSIESSEPSYGIPCAVCGKFIPITQSEARYITFRLCDECIDAILWVKMQMKSVNMNVFELLNEVDKKIDNKEDDGK